MKYTHTFFVLFLLFVGIFEATAFDSKTGSSNYVVIGAFAVQEHADVFILSAKKLSLQPMSAINPNRHLFYVYVLQTSDRGEAFLEAARIRKATPFLDTWVYSGKLGDDVPVIQHQEEQQPVTEQVPNSISTETATPSESNSANSLQPVETEASSVVQNISEPVANLTEGSKNFYFKIEDGIDHKQLTGDIDLIDVVRARRMASYSGNQNVIVQRVGSGKMSFLCEVFGYRKVQQDINFDQPEGTETVSNRENQTIVSFELARLKKGDKAIMYNVYFYKDAAIMRPESKYEVTSLLDMMKENQKYKIRIHGHTNGGAPGKIISMGDSKNFFSLADTKEGVGSAKKLSEQRAEVIRDYLVSNGIGLQRMEIKAWGGKHPIHDKNSDRAGENVRVEIEILDDK
jgi:outer membrane protein OmpA-like peptidoglycan-associated protein